MIGAIHLLNTTYDITNVFTISRYNEGRQVTACNTVRIDPDDNHNNS